MPSPGAQPVPGKDAMDLGGGLAATVYSDGGVVVWRIAPPNDEVAYIEAGRQDPADLGDGRAAYVKPDGSVDVFDINAPPPEYSGAPAAGPPGAPAAPGAPTGLARPGAGRYPTAFPGQTTPGRPTDVPFGSTVAPSTWNPAVPSQGRSEGWGSIGAGTAGVPYGWGVPGFGQAPIKINEGYLDNLFDPKVAPGYIPGSGTYNQFRLDQPGLFGTLPGQQGEVNLRYGLGGTGDPTTGGEVQTPERWVQGTGSTQAAQGDAAWRQRYGGGGGYDPAQAVAVVPPYQYPPSGGAAVSYGTGGGGAGGGMFTAGPGFSPGEQGKLWGQSAGTAGYDSLVTLFMRSDTPTGISTAAWSAPDQYWQLLLQAIRDGKVVVSSPEGWAMLKQKNPQFTPQNIGGAALTGASGASASGGSGTGSTEDAIANGNAAEAADKAAYWAYQQSLLRQGDQRIALDEARQAWQKEYETASLSGQLGGQDTMAMQQQKWQQGFSQQQHQDTTALGLMGLQASLSGPRNWARYQSTFNATPGGLKDVIAAFQGKYQLPGTSGAQAQAQGGKASVAGLAGDILSGTYGNDTTQQPATLANPYQADLQNWAKMAPSQREMILGNYENEGWYGPDVEKLIKGAAPKYGGASGAQYNFFQQ